MADIFKEVEEDVRRERYEQLWKKYHDYIIAAAALVVIGAAAIQLYRVYEQRQEEKAAVAYAAAMQMLDSGQPGAAIPQLVEVANTSPSGYAKVARLAQADAMFMAGSRGAAMRIYEQIASGSDPYLSAVARLHAAWAAVDGSSGSELQTLLGPLTDPGNPWRELAREVLAYHDLRSGNTAAALTAYRELAADSDARSSLRARAKAMVLFLEAGGDANFGTVPLPKPPASPAQATRSPTGVPLR